MSAQVTINPSLVSNAAGTFGVTWDGLVQGTAQPDPAARFSLSGGWLDSSETLPMWGGVGISEKIPTTPGSPPITPLVGLGGPVVRATNVTGGSTAKTLTGFSVFDQAYGMINSPQSPVPLAGTYGQVMFYRLGSGARIAVAMAPSLVSLYGDPITQQVSWDYVNQMLVPYSAAYPQTTISGATWASTAGGQTTFTVGTDLTADLSAGSIIEVQQVVNTGGVSTSVFNGQWTVVSVSSSTIVVTQPAASSPGTYASGGIVVAGGGALSCKILRVLPSNCMTVNYNSTTGFATWNYNAAAALILI